MDFEWDEAKNEANFIKHGIGFEEAIGIFAGPIVRRIDARRDYGEVRVLATGIRNDEVWTVVYAIRDDKRRIISARRRSRVERRAYRAVYS
jgi:uncharacterized protein